MSRKKISISLLVLAIFLVAVFLVWRSAGEEGADTTEEAATQQDQSETQEGAEENEGSAEEQTETQEETETVVYQGEFELPVEGAAGYSSIELPLYASPDTDSEVQTELAAGSGFEVLSEEGEWWQVETAENTGWLQHKFAFINLPDVIPSIIYDNTNSYSSIFTSSYREIPNLTGHTLYQARDYNERLGEDSFIMPILYSTAKKVNEAQQSALENNESLKIYETYRPYETQQRVVDSLANLAQEDAVVWEGLNRGPWSQPWFIITGEVSNHQIGAAMDVSLVRVDEMEERVVGDYVVPEVSDYTELAMQTPMHELSADSVAFQHPVPNDSKIAWQNQPLADAMTEPAKRLQRYATESGFSPIASEWWHFNDLDALESLGDQSGTGEFEITQTLNSQPEHNEEDSQE